MRNRKTDRNADIISAAVRCICHCWPLRNSWYCCVTSANALLWPSGRFFTLTTGHESECFYNSSIIVLVIFQSEWSRRWRHEFARLHKHSKLLAAFAFLKSNSELATSRDELEKQNTHNDSDQETTHFKHEKSEKYSDLVCQAMSVGNRDENR